MDRANMQGTLEALRSFIQQSRLSEYRVAQMMGVSSNALKGWLNGASHPRPGSQTEIRAFLEQHGPRVLTRNKVATSGNDEVSGVAARRCHVVERARPFRAERQKRPLSEWRRSFAELCFSREIANYGNYQILQRRKESLLPIIDEIIRYLRLIWRLLVSNKYVVF
jgi:transcriptional regulator with XRE-family HTH domain